MAYTPATMGLALQLIGGKFRIWEYLSPDPFSTVDDTDYFALVAAPGSDIGIEEGDLVICVENDTDPPGITIATVTAIDSDGNATVGAVVMGTSPSVVDLTASGTVTGTTAVVGGTGSFTALTATGAVNLGDAAADVLGFHGATAVSQRAHSIMATTLMSAASYISVSTNLSVWATEITNTVNLLGLHKGQA